MCNKHNFFFEFDKAFTDQLIRKFNSSPAHPLTEEVAPPERGVYAIYRQKKLIYAGKALQTTLQRRLAEHARKISERKNISLRGITCRFLVVDSDWFVRAGEHALIETFEPEWNQSGFGNHVPGRGRPGIRRSLWDTKFPPK